MARTRGINVTPIPATAFAHLEINGNHIEESWLMDRGEGERPRYAVINTEGVFNTELDGLVHVYNAWRDAAYAVSVERIAEECQGVDQDDLADVVRTFGSRLESNYSGARRWALRQL